MRDMPKEVSTFLHEKLCEIGYPMGTPNFNRIIIIMDYHGLSWIIMDYDRLSWIIMDYDRLSWIMTDCHHSPIEKCQFWGPQSHLGLGWVSSVVSATEVVSVEQEGADGKAR